MVVALALVAAATVQGDESVVLFDAEGFADEAVYPLGDLRPVAHGEGQWTPASGTAQPGQIVTLEGDRFPRALRRQQTGQEVTDADLLDFPPTAASRLTIAFDARVSAADSRTLDVYLLRPGETEARHQASILIWGYHPGKVSCFDGEYHDLADIDTAWHRYEMVHDLAAGTFDLSIDGKPVGQRLGWRNRFAPQTTFGRLRIAAIRGRQGEYADLTNLRITAAPGPPTVTVAEPRSGGLVDPDEGFHFHVTADRPVEASAITVSLNGEDVTGLSLEGTCGTGKCVRRAQAQ